MEQALRNLVAQADQLLVSRGIRMRCFERNGSSVVQAMVPVRGQPPLIVEASVGLPGDVVGGKLGRKVKAKVKHAAKAIAKSKVLKGIVKAAATLAVPGGAEIMMGAKAIKLAKKLKHVAKHGTPKQKVVAKAIAHRAAANVKKARMAPPVAQGYPDAYASRLPGEAPPAGNGLPDSDEQEMSEAMDPDQGDPSGSVEQDEDEEIGPSEDAPSDDEAE